MVDDPGLALTAHRHRHRLEPDDDLADGPQPAFARPEDLQPVVGRVDGEEQVSGRPHRQGADVPRFEEDGGAGGCGVSLRHRESEDAGEGSKRHEAVRKGPGRRRGRTSLRSIDAECLATDGGVKDGSPIRWKTQDALLR
jgi:hypothetical protein